MKWASGSSYDGDWVDNKKHGFGVYKLSNGEIYVGEWKFGKRHGKGVNTWGSGSAWAGDSYDGDWVDGKKHGWGNYRFADDPELEEYDGEWVDDERTGYGKMMYRNKNIFNGYEYRNNLGDGFLLNPDGGVLYSRTITNEYQGFTMNANLSFLSITYKNSTNASKGFMISNITSGTIQCFQFGQGGDISIPCHRQNSNLDTIYLNGFDHYYVGDTITIRSRKVQDGFGELGNDGSYYVGEWKLGEESGFGLKSDLIYNTKIGTFKNGLLEGSGATISYSVKHRTVYFGNYKKGKLDGPGLFIYPDGERVVGYFNEGKLDHSKNPLYIHSDGTRDTLVPTFV